MGVVMPCRRLPAFYNHPKTVDDVIDHIVFPRARPVSASRPPFAKRWDGHMQTAATIAAVGGAASEKQDVKS